ncbi:kxDL motif-containing protein CG10681-like [Clavelina lepadiformis]|uniref:kxDL motif-containing protein CG10681-like n=1 Tax=Clavelina lepadiformis TaxID=159417 RepID=UPI004041033E
MTSKCSTIEAEGFCDSLTQIINKDDMAEIIKGQKSMLKHLEKTNQMLLNCNNIAEQQQAIVFSKFQRHTALLKDVKKDLQSVHTRIKRLKLALQTNNHEWLVIGENNGSNPGENVGPSTNAPSIN